MQNILSLHQKMVKNYVMLRLQRIYNIKRTCCKINSNLDKISNLFMKSRAGDIKHSCADITLAKNKINYSPEIVLKRFETSMIESFTFHSYNKNSIIEFFIYLFHRPASCFTLGADGEFSFAMHFFLIFQKKRV